MTDDRATEGEQFERHLDDLEAALRGFRGDAARVGRWADHLHATFERGGRLLAAGNGGSAAEAQHLTAELLGRFMGERRPLPAISLHTDTSACTAICNDYGAEQVYARQVRAHAGTGDVLVLLSTSGRSANVLAAAHAARELGVTSWALTGPAPNPLASACDDAICVGTADPATVQEVHLVAVHALCAALERAIAAGPALAYPDEVVV